MQKKILAAVVGSMIAGQAMAVTVVDDGTNKVTIGGHVGMRYQYNKESGVDNTTKGDSSRINFGFESKLTQDTTAFAKAEWGFDTTNTGGSGDFFSQRLGYVGVKNDLLGSVSFGKQWSSYYTIAGWTDVFATEGGDAVGAYGDDGEVLGTSRADDALQYNFSMNGLNISAQMQAGSRKAAQSYDYDADGTDDFIILEGTRDRSYGLAASYDLPMGLSFGVAYNEAKVKDAAVEGYDPKDYKAKSTIVGFKFEADKFYAAATYADLKNRVVSKDMRFVEKGKGYEVYGSYQMNDSFKFETGYNQLKDKDDDVKAQLKYFPVGVVYTTGPLQLSGTYVFESSKDIDGADKKDRAILQARYYF